MTKRVGTGLACAALLLVAGCGSDGSDPAARAKYTSAPNVPMVKGCPSVQAALDAHLSKGGPIYTKAQYQGFVDDLEKLSAKLDASGQVILRSLVDASRDSVANAGDASATPEDNLRTASALLAAIKQVGSTCKALGAPLS